MRIGLLTDGGYPYATGESRLWCDRLVRGLDRHEFDVFALARTPDHARGGRLQVPDNVTQVRTAALWAPADDGRGYGRRERRRFAEHFAALAGAVCAPDADPHPGDGPAAPAGATFAEGLYGLAELARERGGLHAALRSESAVRIIERACRAPGVRREVRAATVPDYLVFADRLERALRPVSLRWYGEQTTARAAMDPGAGSLARVDLCHAASGGSAALPGLLAKRFFGIPLLVTEYGVQVRAHYLATGAGGTDAASPLTRPVRSLFASYQGLLAAEVYRQAGAITSGNVHARRWQQRCGADRARLRTVHPGMEAGRFAAVGESGDPGDPDTLVWVGRIEPSKDLVGLLHAFAAVREERPGARLRIVGTPAGGEEAAAYLAQCRALAAQLFPDVATGAHAVGENPVSFEEIGTPGVPDLPEAYAAGSVVVLSSTAEGFPLGLVEAMFCGRATVSTDVGAVVEVVGGTGVVVPPRNPRALADACLALLADEARRNRLGAAARARALELFTVEQNIAAFRALYLEIVSHEPAPCPVRADDDPLPFAVPAEAHVRGVWTAGNRPPGRTPHRVPASTAGGGRA